MMRWAKSGVLDQVFEAIQARHIIQIKIEAVALDSTIIQVHPEGTGAQKNGPHAIGKSRGGWTTQIHRVAASERCAITVRRSPGQDHDAPAGRQLLIDFGSVAGLLR